MITLEYNHALRGENPPGGGQAAQKPPRPERIRIDEKIYRLGQNPDGPELDVKPLQGEPLLRLRVGDWRAIFDRRDDLKIIAIERVRARGDAYK